MNAGVEPPAVAFLGDVGAKRRDAALHAGFAPAELSGDLALGPAHGDRASDALEVFRGQGWHARKCTHVGAGTENPPP